jgi:regulator of sigma E protease
MSTVLATLVVLGVLIFIHELGHFLAGKAVDVEIQRFSIGVGPKLFGYKYGETDYVFSWIPLGGYCKFGGMGEDEMLEKLEGGGDGSPRTPGPRDFDAKPIWARALILSAGVIFNMLFAFGAFTYVIAEWGVPELRTTRIGIVHDEFLPPGTENLMGISAGSRFVRIGETEVGSWGDVERGLFEAPSGPIRLDLAEPDQSVEIRIPVTEAERRALVRSVEGWVEAGVGSVVPGGPADEGGLEPGDRVTAVAGIDVEGWFEFTSEIRSRPGERVEITLVREGREIIRPVTLDTEEEQGVQVGRMGVYQPVGALSYSPVPLTEAVVEGYGQTVLVTGMMLGFLRDLVTGGVSPRSLGSILMIGEASGQAAAAGLDSFLSFMALFSVNLAILNLLPIPVLDGGHLAFLVIEGVRGKALSFETKMRWSQVGFVIIMGIMVLALSNDFLRVLGF